MVMGGLRVFCLGGDGGVFDWSVGGDGRTLEAKGCCLVLNCGVLTLAAKGAAVAIPSMINPPPLNFRIVCCCKDHGG